MNCEHRDIIITSKSPLHIGSGTGVHGSLDSIVVRDRDGLPYIPASSLLLRVAMEYAVKSLKDKETWKMWIDWLLGDKSGKKYDSDRGKPIDAKLRISDLHLVKPDFLIDVGSESVAAAVKSAVYEVHSATKISDKTQTAEKDSLRMREYSVRGSEYKGILTLPAYNKESDWPAEYLILVAISLTDRIGGKRRRGAGKVEVKVGKFANGSTPLALDWSETGESDLDRLKELFEFIDSGKPVPEPKFNIDNDDNGTISSLGKSVKSTPLEHKFDLHINLKTAITIEDTSHAKGSYTASLDYIPGSALLPAIARVFNHKAITSNQVLVTNATPADIYETRTLPWPRHIQRLKSSLTEDDDKIIKNIFEVNNNEKKVGFGGYISRVAENNGVVNPLVNVQVAMKDEIHNEYMTQAISENTKFIAEVWTNIEEEKLTKIQDFIDKKEIDRDYKMGLSRKKTNIQIEWMNHKLNDKTSDESSEQISQLHIWAVSDILLRDEKRLVYTVTTDALVKEIENKLSIELDSDKPIENSEIVTVRRETWQGRWGLYRPTLPMIGAGSVVVLNLKEPVYSSDLFEAIERIESNGIGERRAEGYGRVLVNAPECHISSNREFEMRDATSKSNDENVGVSDLKVLLPLAFGIVDETIDNIFREPKRCWKTLGLQKNISLTQLGNLRAKVEEARSNKIECKDDISVIKKWCKQKKGYEDKENQWRKLSEALSATNDVAPRIFGGEYDAIISNLPIKVLEDKSNREIIKSHIMTQILFRCLQVIRTDKKKTEAE
jgi:CRISPR-associated protein Csx10